MTLSSIFFTHANATPSKCALACEGETTSYAALAHQVRVVSAALVARGVRPGDRCGVVLPNTREFVVLMLVAAELGLVLVPLPPSLPAAAMESAFAATSIRHLFATPEVSRGLSGMITEDGLVVSCGPAQESGDFVRFGDLVAEPASFGWGQESDPYILTMTSGSTSAPKPILLTQATKIQRAMAAMRGYDISSADVTLAATPLYHSLAERLVLIPLLSGGTSVLLARFSPTQWLDAVQRHGVTFTIAVSSQLSQIAEAVVHRPVSDSLRCIVSSSGRLDFATKELLRDRFRCALHECYGTSEIGIATSLNLSEESHSLASVGRPVAGAAIRIFDRAGNVVPEGELGEIGCATDALFGGYFERPDLTAAAMWGDYFRTGDLGRLDGNGYLHFVGRLKDTINTGGITVHPTDVEAALIGYPGLVEAAAFALPDEQLGEVIGLAYVCGRGGGFDLRHLRHHCGRHLADFQQPHKFLALAALPRNGMGKLTRHVLPSLYLARTGSHG